YSPPKPVKGKPAFKPLTGTPPACASQYTAQNYTATSSAAGAGGSNPPPVDSNALFAEYANNTPLNSPNNATILSPLSGQPSTRFELGPAALAGSDVANAAPQLVNGQWTVGITFTSSGSTKFDQFAQAQYHKITAIVLDAQVVNDPIIESTNYNGQAQISGLSQAQAQSLAIELQYGQLPVVLSQQSAQSVTPTLGANSLHAGLIAGIAGLILVMLYTILYYRGLGVVVVLGLATTGALLFALISYLGRSIGLTLDLSGVTGLIVSVGITVDSYIVYFERLKDEIRSGLSVRTSVDRGFSKAYKTVVVADSVSLIAAATLYLLSVGAVKGFAFFLGMSTVLDLITAYAFTRPLVILLGRNQRFTNARFIGIGRGLLSESKATA
ncbi:MAG: protein translocase subunit SecD, partial [Acidimicrobiales bacterium]|nr:protein translocase subunit SecD [Acidimicrobiales bacterium]